MQPKLQLQGFAHGLQVSHSVSQKTVQRQDLEVIARIIRLQQGPNSDRPSSDQLSLLHGCLQRAPVLHRVPADAGSTRPSSATP